MSSQKASLQDLILTLCRLIDSMNMSYNYKIALIRRSICITCIYVAVAVSNTQSHNIVLPVSIIYIYSNIYVYLSGGDVLWIRSVSVSQQILWRHVSTIFMAVTQSINYATTIKRVNVM